MPPRKKAKKNKDAEHGEQPKDVEEQLAATDLMGPTSAIHEDTIAHFTIPFGEKEIACERQGLEGTPPPLIFTHGAGGGIDSPACRDFAAGFSTISPIVSFQGPMNLKNRIKAFHTVLEHAEATPGKSSVALGGRSMGARAAVLTALELDPSPEALVLVSYPLMAGSHGEKREPERREQILLDVAGEVDVLFVIGSEDKMCDLQMLNELREKMKARTWLCVVRGADHGVSLRPKKAVQEVRERSGSVAATWLQDRNREKRCAEIRWDEEEEKVIGGEWRAEEEEVLRRDQSGHAKGV